MLKRILSGAVGVLFLATLLTAQTRHIIYGQITDAQTGKPLSGANVFIVPDGPGTASDAIGRFKLKLPEGRTDSLRITFMGYRPATLATAEITGELHIKLEATTVLFVETVVTATRQAAVRATVPAATELIEIGSPSRPVGIARQNAGEVLAHSQSILVKEYGGVNGLKTISLRGAGDGQVLVLTDGVRLNNPQNGGVDAGLLSLVGIDKIEIVRGNASAQYGSDAIGGVIHLRSLQPRTGFSGAVQTGGGSFGAFNSRVQLGYGNARWRGMVVADRLVSDGDFLINGDKEDKRRNNSSQRREIFARVSGGLHKNLNMNILHRTSKTEQGVPGSLQFPSAVAQQKDWNHLTSAALDWSRGQWLQLTAQFSSERRDQRYDDPAFFMASHHEVASDIASLQNRTQLGSTLALLLGGEIGHYHVTSTDIGKPERTQRSAFVQTEWRPLAGRRQNGWQITVMPSLRYDDYSDAGNRASPKLALALNRQTSTRLNLHGSVGESFRVPSMNDLFWPTGQYVAGNPNLQPEKGREIEGGVLYEFSRAGHWQIELAAFNTKIKDLIVWTADANFRFSPTNLDDAEISGIELGTAWRSNGDRLGWRATYTRLSAKNESRDPATNGKDLIYRPADKFDLQADFNFQYFTLSGSFQFVGKRFINADNSKSLPAYRLLNLAISREMHWGDFHTLLHAEVRNVFDKHFSIIDGYPMPGREFRATLRLGY